MTSVRERLRLHANCTRADPKGTKNDRRVVGRVEMEAKRKAQRCRSTWSGRIRPGSPSNTRLSNRTPARSDDAALAIQSSIDIATGPRERTPGQAPPGPSGLSSVTGHGGREVQFSTGSTYHRSTIWDLSSGQEHRLSTPRWPPTAETHGRRRLGCRSEIRGAGGGRDTASTSEGPRGNASERVKNVGQRASQRVHQHRIAAIP